MKLEYSECQCNHVSHFDTTKRTPRGAWAHKYGAKWAPPALVVVETDVGPFRVCAGCRQDCYAHQPQAEFQPKPKL